jgi:putative transposase
MEYSYKFRIYPTAVQAEQIQKTFGCCRFVWNHYLALRKELYEQDRKTMNYNTCSGDMTQLKQTLLWLKEVDATALQSSLRDLDMAYQNFFRRVKRGQKPGYPRFKSKHDHRQSYKSKCGGTNIKVLDKAVQCRLLPLVKSKVTFIKVITMLNAVFGYEIEQGRSMIEGRQHTYRLIVAFNEDEKCYVPAFKTINE